MHEGRLVGPADWPASEADGAGPGRAGPGCRDDTVCIPTVVRTAVAALDNRWSVYVGE